MTELVGAEIHQPVSAIQTLGATGTLTLLQGNNSVVHAHGLGRTPTALVGANSDVGQEWYYVVDGTNLTIYLSAEGLALSNLTFTYVLI